VQGYQLINTAGGMFSYTVQECRRCANTESILNSSNPKYACQECPAGAVCDGNSLTGKVNGSVWMIDYNIGRYILESCPKV
jgi:hypothetical protein